MFNLQQFHNSGAIVAYRYLIIGGDKLVATGWTQSCTNRIRDCLASINV